MSETPPENPPTNPPANPPVDTPPAPTAVPVTAPAPPSPNADMDEVKGVLGQLVETVGKLVTNADPMPVDHSPVKKPWTHWGSR